MYGEFLKKTSKSKAQRLATGLPLMFLWSAGFFYVLEVEQLLAKVVVIMVVAGLSFLVATITARGSREEQYLPIKSGHDDPYLSQGVLPYRNAARRKYATEELVIDKRMIA